MKYSFFCANNSKNFDKNYFMPKVAVVIPKYGLVGGAEQFAAELTDACCSRTDFTFQVFANRWQSDSKCIGFQKVPIISFPKFLTTISFAWFAERRLKRSPFDLVHSHERIFAADIYTLHGIPHRYWINQIRRKKTMSLYDLATAWVERKLVYEGGCGKFIAVSELTRQIFLKAYPIDPARVAVVHPGVHLPDDAQKNKINIRTNIRRELGIGAGDLVVIFASMNFEIKGLDEIFLAIARLPKQSRQLKLIVAGKGNIKKYRQAAQRAGIAGQVIFTGVVTRDRLSDLYRAGDLYMMLSQFDTFGMVVLEAMAEGLPVIVSSNVGAKDLAQEGKNGFVIADTSNRDLIASKIQMMFDDAVRLRMSDAAYQTATQNTWARTAAKYSDIYTEVLDARKRKGF